MDALRTTLAGLEAEGDHLRQACVDLGNRSEGLEAEKTNQLVQVRTRARACVCVCIFFRADQILGFLLSRGVCFWGIDSAREGFRSL